MKLKLLVLSIFTITLFYSCGSDDSSSQQQETLTEKNYRLINGTWKITLRTVDGLVTDLGTCLINNEVTYNSDAKAYNRKEYYVNNNTNDCLFDEFTSDFEINANTLITNDGSIGISNTIDLLDDTTLKTTFNNETLTWTRQ